MDKTRPNERSNRTQSFRPNIFQPMSPPRVNTDPATATAASTTRTSSRRPHLHGLHHHPHHHHHHHHHRRHHHSRDVKDTVQSATQLTPPTSFGDLLKQASKGKDSSGSDGRGENPSRELEVREEGSQERPQQVVVRSEDVEKERKKAHARARELRAAFQDASEQSLKSSRRLDDTYYSILEKVGVLRQTIGSLQELSSMTKELHANLETDTKELVDDVQGQFEAFGDFETQKSQVNDLEERIKAGKEKADALTKRLESARQRVEARAKIEAEGEAKISRRLRIVWGVAVLVLCMIVVAILFQQLKPTRRPHAHPSLHFEARQNLIDIMEGMPESAKQALAVPLSSRPTRSSKFAPTPSVLVDDDRLRIFDEL